MFICLALPIAVYGSFPGLGFAGGESIKGALNAGLVNQALASKRKLPAALPYDPNAIALDPLYQIKRQGRDNLISRSNLLTTPVPDATKEKILSRSDNYETVPYDTTRGFINPPREYEKEPVFDPIIRPAKHKIAEPIIHKPKLGGQALVLDPFDPTRNTIVDLPLDPRFYPANNPYIMVSPDQPFKLKKKPMM